jgi:hypothetical protein
MESWGVAPGDGECWPSAKVVNLTNSRKGPDFLWTSIGEVPIMLAVGSANLSLLAVSFWSAASASFSRTSWRASILAPFFAAPKVTLGCDFFQLQEMHTWERSFIVAI